MKRVALLVAVLVAGALGSAQYQPPKPFYPPLLQTKVTVTSAQIKTCFSSPTTLIPAVSNALILPEITNAYKNAGTAYGVAGVGVVGLKWNDAGKTAIDNFSAAGLLDSAAATSWVAQGAGSSVSMWTLLGGGQYGQAVIFHCAGADPTAPGDMTITYWISYRVWPNAPLD